MLSRVLTVVGLLLLLTPALASAQGFVVVSGDDADDSGHCQGTRCGGLYPRIFNIALEQSRSGGQGIVAVGVNSSNALSAFNGWNNPSNGGPGAPVTHLRTVSEITSVDFNQFAVIYIASVSNHTSGGLTSTQVAALNARQPDIAEFVNERGGSLIALTQANRSGGWGFLPVPLETRNTSFTDATPTESLALLSPNTTRSNLSHCCFHNVFTGPPEFSGLEVLAVRTNTNDAVMLGGLGTILTAEVCDDGIDNDDDGLIDREDPDCRICGDGIRDPGEQCDDGNTTSGDGCSDICRVEGPQPQALCQSPSVFTDFGVCGADLSIDAGSHDAQGDPVSVTHAPASPFPPGTTSVTLTVTDDTGSTATCNAPVTVTDAELPVALCGTPVALDSAVGSAVFAPGGTDNCPVKIEISDLLCRDDDVDDDGVADDEDECPDSELSEVLVLAECDTGVINHLFASGCTFFDRIFICGEEARNHGEFVSCVAHLTNEWRSLGLITGHEKGEVQRCAAQAPIPIPRGPQLRGLVVDAAGVETEPVACPAELDNGSLLFTELPSIGELSWTLLATDGSGNQVSAECSVAVQNPSTTFVNLEPRADAGPDQEALRGQTVSLDGSGSLDLDGGTLTYAWSLISRPAESTVVLSGEATAQPSLVVDAPGVYVAELIVNDGELASPADRMEIRVRNRRPTAVAGPDLRVFLGETVVFDGSGSFDADGNAVTHQWVLARQPAGSTATLSDPTTAAPSLTVDARGIYVAQLTVSDGALTSLIDAAVLVVPNQPPLADAGSDQDVSVFDEVQLDGSGSSDPEGDSLTYQWTTVSLPSGSSVALNSDTIVDPIFVPDVAGVYVFELVVSDGIDVSAPDRVVVTTVNTPPVADAGPNQTAFLDDLVQLDGSGSSDVDNDPLTFQWELFVKPAGSVAELSDPTAVAPTFLADVRGSYAARLVVDDGQRLSQPDTVTIAVINRAPVADAGDDHHATVDVAAFLDGSDTFDPDGDLITYQWSLVSRPSGSAAVTLDPVVQPVFFPDRAGDYVFQLVTSDADLSSSPVAVTVTAFDGGAPPNADAGRDRAALVNQSVSLDGSASRDVDGDMLSFAWTFASVPAGSALINADLVAPDTAQPTFTPDVEGTFLVTLTVADGGLSDADTVQVEALAGGVPPFADAGPDSAFQSSEVPLLISRSLDLDGTPQPLSFEWTLVARPAGSGLTSDDLITPLTDQASFVPDVLGSYVFRLEVSDGAATEADNVVVVLDDDPPGLAFDTPTEGQAFFQGGTPEVRISFFDVDSGIDLSTFDLEIDGEDVTSETTVGSTFAVFTLEPPLEPGSYTATATVADRAGNVTSASRNFEVSDAVFRAIADCAPTEGTVPLTVRFRSRGEFSDGTIIRFRWDFEGDGRFDTSDAVARDFIRTFDTSGVREAVLEVTNNFNQRTTDTCIIRVEGEPPSVTADAQPSNGPVPLDVALTCVGEDFDGQIVLYEWDFEGDGTFDFNSPDSGSAAHTYDTEGTFVAVCRVTDDDGLTATAETANTVIRPGPPGSPSVVAIASVTDGEAPLAVDFDGTASDDGQIVLWEWDFDGDGTFDVSSPSSPLASFTYLNGGVFAATLRATDDSGLSSIDVVEIRVGLMATLTIPDDTFDPSLGETVEIQTDLSGGVPVRVFIRDGSGETVRSLVDEFRSGGTYLDPWDGTDDDGFPLPHGPYFAILEYDLSGETVRVDLTNTTGGQRYNPPRDGFPRTFAPLDNDLLDINFTIPNEASEVTAFIGLFRVDTRFVTLLDRVPFGVGAHQHFWDGTGPTGGIAVPPPGDSFLFGIFAFTLPDNAIMLQAAPNLTNVSVEPNFFDPATPGFLTPEDPVAVLTYDLDKQADVELTVTNLETGVVLRRIVQQGVEPAAGLTIDWNGRAEDGLFVDKGDYRLTLRAVDTTGSASVNRFALVRVFY